MNVRAVTPIKTNPLYNAPAKKPNGVFSAHWYTGKKATIVSKVKGRMMPTRFHRHQYHERVSMLSLVLILAAVMVSDMCFF